ncbi:hypothetical protein [Yoonia sp. SS1-5]|uniref:Uncharacterized protein n=1 Tax=Yoonia rhodophyticola TaxID=3137370 RepID=A0AAN0MAV5_9RHOB
MTFGTGWVWGLALFSAVAMVNLTFDLFRAYDEAGSQMVAGAAFVVLSVLAIGGAGASSRRPVTLGVL